MNITRLIFFITLLCFACPDAVLAQGKKKKSKSSRDTKRELSEYYYDIEKYERAKYEVGQARVKADSITAEIERMRRMQEQNQEEIARLSAEKERNAAKVRELEQKAGQPAERKQIPQTGVFFSVQIGAYSKRDIAHLLNQAEGEMSVEEENGTKKYLLGGYGEYEGAAAARRKIRQMGVKDAWIVAYKDGKRVPMTEVRTTPISDEELKELNKKQTP